jgi:CYTH domain-containing protein
MKDEVERRFFTTSTAWQDLIDPQLDRFIVQAYPDELQAEGEFGRIRDTLLPDGTHVFEIGRKLEAQGFNTPEDEQETLQAEAERLFRAAGLNTLRKWRSFLPLGPGVTVMIDRFTHIRGDRVDDLVISEIEFSGAAVATAADFEPPVWIGVEITGRHEWSNVNLCRRGIPLRPAA